MQIIIPQSITDGALTYSSIAEPSAGEVLWSAIPNYSIGAEVIRTETHRKYKRLIAGTTASPPESDTSDPPNWLDIGPTNKWAMFDDVIGTNTTSSSSPLTVRLQTTGVGGLYAAEVNARTVVVSIKDAPGGSVVYTQTIDLDATIVTSFYDWFFNEFTPLTEFSLTDFPYHYSNAELEVTFSGTSLPLSCGVLKFGKSYTLGRTQYGATSSITDYSKKEQDEFGRISVLKRSFSKRASYEIWTEKSAYTWISRLLSSIRATPCIFIGTDYAGYEPLTIYGFYKDYSINVQYPTVHYCSLDVEGLI